MTKHSLTRQTILMQGTLTENTKEMSICCQKSEYYKLEKKRT